MSSKIFGKTSFIKADFVCSDAGSGISVNLPSHKILLDKSSCDVHAVTVRSGVMCVVARLGRGSSVGYHDTFRGV